MHLSFIISKDIKIIFCIIYMCVCVRVYKLCLVVFSPLDPKSLPFPPGQFSLPRHPSGGRSASAA